MVSAAQMVEVDRLMQDKYGIKLIQMMENAGHALARLVHTLHPQGSILVLAGTGGNGGGGLVAARWLCGWGRQVSVVTTRPRTGFRDVPGHQLDSVGGLAAGLGAAASKDELARIRTDIIIDGVLGYSMSGKPRGLARHYIEFMNESQAAVVSLDLPSGIHPDKGVLHPPVVKADQTLTLALPKASFEMPEVKEQLGELYLADIGVPRQLWDRHFSELDYQNPFEEGDVVRLK